MANIPAPAINFGSADNPQAAASVVLQENIAPGGLDVPAVYTSGVIGVPKASDILRDPGVGYAS